MLLEKPIEESLLFNCIEAEILRNFWCFRIWHGFCNKNNWLGQTKNHTVTMIGMKLKYLVTPISFIRSCQQEAKC
jgi:hypothetical protein